MTNELQSPSQTEFAGMSTKCRGSGSSLGPQISELSNRMKLGTELRILPVGDSITVGCLADDHNGCREQPHSNLSGDLHSTSLSTICY